jgi:subtilisin family serine protease
MLAAAGCALAQGEKTIEVSGNPTRVMDRMGVTRLLPRRAVAGRVLVQMKPQRVSTAGINNIVTGLQASLRRLIGKRGPAVMDLPAGADLPTTITRLQANPDVESVSPDYIVYPTVTPPSIIPTDPSYSLQYHLPLISMPLAWGVTTGSSSVIVGVVDAGVNINHPDLVGRIWTNPNPTMQDSTGAWDVHGWNFVPSENNANVVPIGSGVNQDHGTLVAGTLGATANNGIGGCGVNWACQIMPVKVFPVNDGSATSVVLQGLEYAVSHGAQIVNMSLGGSWDPSWTQPILEAYNAGVLVVVAAGNDSQLFTTNSSTWESPVCNHSGGTDLVGVAATDQNDKRTWFTNYDASGEQFVAVSAPGASIYGPLFTGYGSEDGTSFSSPIVSGIAALILAVHPGYTPTQLLTAITSTADNINALNPGYANELGAGRVNAARALGVTIPPGVPSNFAAANTPNSNGGSITITWVKSSDDGAGANNVTGYILYRGTTAGSLQQIASLAPGTQSYVDSPVTDGQPYYYQLEVDAGAISSTTSVVGPVYSGNSSIPPQVTTLVAVDNPNDSGGAILLTWTGYVAPSDFASYKVYRSTSAFNTVATMTAIATITNAGTQTYLDSTTTDGTDYYYAVTAVDTAGNVNNSVVDAGPVQSYPNGNVSVPAGTSFLAAATVPSDHDPATLFGLAPSALNYVRWNTSSVSYEQYTTAGQLSNNLLLQLGHGFWVNLSQTATMSATGQSAPAGDFTISIVPGWQQLGNPFFGALDFSGSTVLSGTTVMSLAAANSGGIMSSSAWLYNATTGSYTLAYPNVGQGTSLIPPWRGFWVYAYKSCNLTLKRPVGTSGVQQVASASSGASPAGVTTQSPGGFAMSLTANAGGATSPTLYCGVSAERAGYWLASPPPLTSTVAMGFTAGPQGKTASTQSVVSYAPSLSTSLKWQFTVTTGLAHAKVTVACANAAAVPAGYNILLTDVDAGRQQSLRQVPQYAYDSGANAGTRHFTLEITQQSISQVTISGLMTQATHGGGQFVFALSAPASTTVQVMNIAGRIVRMIETGRSRTAGINTVLWDGRNLTGAAVPPGMYLVQIDAADDSGNKVSALQTMNVMK